MSTRRGTIAVPLGIALAVLVAVVSLFANRGGPPARLPVGLAAAGGTAADSELGSDAPAMTTPYGWQRYELAIPVPGDLPTHARAAVMPRREAPRDAVVRLARALGLDGDPVRGDGGWQLLDGEIGLRVSDDPGNPWHYGRGVVCLQPNCGKPVPMPATDLPLVDVDPGAPAGPAGSVPGSTPAPAGTIQPDPAPPVAKPPAPGCTPAPAPATSCTMVLTPCRDASDAPTCVPPCPSTDGAAECPKPECPPDADCATACHRSLPPRCTPPKPLPAKDAALDVARRIMAASGFDDVVLHAEAVYDSWSVTADYRLDGLRVLGGGLHLDLDHANRPEYAGGGLGTPRPGDRYPLLGVAAAIERAAGGPIPDIGCAAPAAECDKLRQARRVTGVELGLLPMPGGEAMYLVPAWLLTVEGSPRPEAVVALPGEYLAEPRGDGRTCERDCDRPVSTDAPAPPDSGNASSGPGVGGGSTGSVGGTEPGTGSAGSGDGTTGSPGAPAGIEPAPPPAEPSPAPLAS